MRLRNNLERDWTIAPLRAVKGIQANAIRVSAARIAQLAFNADPTRTGGGLLLAVFREAGLETVGRLDFKQPSSRTSASGKEKRPQVSNPARPGAPPSLSH